MTFKILQKLELKVHIQFCFPNNYVESQNFKIVSIKHHIALVLFRGLNLGKGMAYDEGFYVRSG